MKKPITLDDVLSQFNPYHKDRDADSLDGALAATRAKREAFNDLFVTIMDPEHEDVREWDDRRWKAVVSLGQDLNGFLRSLDNYYRQELQKAKH